MQLKFNQYVRLKPIKSEEPAVELRRKSKPKQMSFRGRHEAASPTHD